MIIIFFIVVIYTPHSDICTLTLMTNTPIEYDKEEILREHPPNDTCKIYFRDEPLYNRFVENT